MNLRYINALLLVLEVALLLVEFSHLSGVAILYLAFELPGYVALAAVYIVVSAGLAHIYAGEPKKSLKTQVLIALFVKMAVQLFQRFAKTHQGPPVRVSDKKY